MSLSTGKDPVKTVASRHRERLDTLESVCWSLAILATLADWGVTVVLVAQPGFYESVAVSRMALEIGGPLGLLVKDLAMVGALAIVWRGMPHPYRIVVPAAALARWYLVAHNILFLL